VLLYSYSFWLMVVHLATRSTKRSHPIKVCKLWQVVIYYRLATESKVAFLWADLLQFRLDSFLHLRHLKQSVTPLLQVLDSGVFLYLVNFVHFIIPESSSGDFSWSLFGHFRRVSEYVLISLVLPFYCRDEILPIIQSLYILIKTIDFLIGDGYGFLCIYSAPRS
jgi:hypothetical protein